MQIMLPAIICLFKVNNKDTRTVSIYVLVLCITSFETVSIVDIEHVLVCWVFYLYRFGVVHY